MAPDTKAEVSANQLLQALAPQDFALLVPHLNRVELRLRHEMEKPNTPIENVYFPESGFASVVGRGAHQRQLEIGIIGREGMTGLMVVLGNDRSPHSTYMQIGGHGQQVASDALRRTMTESASLRATLLRFAQAFHIQTTHTAISNGSGTIEERLARWLLMAHDRLDRDELPLIHEFLALMLGVRRAGVSAAIRSLEKQGLIRAERANIVVRDRPGLEKLADGSYGVPESEYKRILS